MESAEASSDAATLPQDSLNSSSQDIIFQLIHIGLQFFGKSAVKSKLAFQIVEIIRVICRGKRYLRCHLELIYQFVRTKVNKVIANSLFADKKTKDAVPASKEGYSLVDYCMAMLQAIIEQ